jgi:phosphatidylethanolamine/phosphatidyl-N-methylethanolamine N-methyltransferase
MTPDANATKNRSALREHANFLYQFITKPGMIGAVAPSSPGLAREMLRTIDLGPGARVAEYGPGTGSFTREILARVDPGATFFAIERNPALTAALRGRFPTLRLFEGSVEEIERYCREVGVEQLDAVVSGLPWASFPHDLQTRILDATMRVLRPGGQLVTFTYHVSRLTAAGRRFRRLLPRYFSSITTSRVVWLNTPPAFTIRCVR